MKAGTRILVPALVFLGFVTASSFGQQKTDTAETPLGDIARQLKAQKAKEPKPVMVITNDNIASTESDTSGFGAMSTVKTSTEPPSNATSGPQQVRDEKYFRSRLSSLQDQLATHQRELAVLQQKLGQNEIQYYPDPNKTLRQEYSRSDIDKLTAEIDAKKQQIADDEKAIVDLHDELRHDGGDPGWLR